MVRSLEKCLRMCFNTVKVNKYEVANILELWSAEDMEEEAQKEAKRIYLALSKVKSVDEAISNGMQDTLEEVYRDTILKGDSIEHFGKMESVEWATIFEQYSRLVPMKMEDFVGKMRLRGDLERMQVDVKTALEQCHLKATILFACETDPFYSFPFMSPSVFKAMKSHLGRISDSILEVSCFIQYLCYNSKNHAFHGPPGNA